MKRALALIAVLVACAGAAARHSPVSMAVAAFVVAHLPYVAGSAIPIVLDGMPGSHAISLLGAGDVRNDVFVMSSSAQDAAPTLIAAGPAALAMHTFTVASPPDPGRPFIAVASYDDGIVFHDALPPFSPRSVLGVGGAPSDVAIDASSGTLAAGATNGATFVTATLQPWHTRTTSGIPFVDEVAIDPRTHAVYATNRDVNGAGALTRIAADGTVTRRILGLTAEGLAIDPQRQRIYIANVNDGTISIVNATTMVELSRFHAVDRVFSLALSQDGMHLYATSNQSTSSPFAHAGSAVAFDVGSGDPHEIAQSEPLAFPIGIALDESHHRVFVTDERDDIIDVLSPDLRTIAVLHTCRTPWQPTIDGNSLFVPCARDDQIDVFDLHTLHRAAGAPFSTGGYPLAVAVWHP